MAPLKPSGGKPSQLERYKVQVIEMVAQYPDYTLEEYCEYCEEITGVRLSASIVRRQSILDDLSISYLRLDKINSFEIPSVMRALPIPSGSIKWIDPSFTFLSVLRDDRMFSTLI